MCRNTKPFNGNYHALPGTADSLREALLMCFILANKRQRQTKADAQELNCQRSQQAVAYSTFGPFTSPPTPPRNPQHFPGLDIYLKVSLSFMKHLPLPLYFLPCAISSLKYFITSADKLWSASLLSLSAIQPHKPHNFQHFCHCGMLLQNHRKQWGNQRGAMVWAVSLPLLLMSCNLEQ